MKLFWKTLAVVLLLVNILMGECMAEDLRTDLVGIYEWTNCAIPGSTRYGNNIGLGGLVSAGSYWPANLTNNNAATFVAGKPARATQLTKASTQYWSAADNVALSMGDIDFTICVWVKADSVPTSASINAILGKWNFDTSNVEYALIWEEATNGFDFVVSPNGSDGTTTTVHAATFGAPSTGTWYWIVCEHRATANQIAISVNNGTADTASHSTGVFNGTSDFQVGRLHNVFPWDGQIGQLLMYKRLLTADQKTELYNSGNGLRLGPYGT